MDFYDRPGSALSDDSDRSQNVDMWSSMLSSVASSKRLPQKSMVVLGGTGECQKEFVESLSVGRKKGEKKPPIANAFALGYTYLDVLDADHEDVIARLGLYLVSKPEPALMPILKSLFTATTIPDTLVVILLDWLKPWEWMRQLRTWVRLLSTLFNYLDDNAKRALDDVTQAWQSRRSIYADAGSTGPEVILPLGKGEFDEPIGLPLCVICQNADKIETLERERGWKDGLFDFVLQSLRTVLLKHGASLIYTIPSVQSSLTPLLFSLLSIPSPLRNHTIKHNIIDRDKILIPGPGWDSWGKIRVLGEAFDVEGICSGWSRDISPGLATIHDDVDSGAVEFYEDVIKDPMREDDSLTAALKQRGIEVQPVDTQEFLAMQMGLHGAGSGVGDTLGKDRGGPGSGSSIGADSERGHGRTTSKTLMLTDGTVRDQVGPVQVNVGGIQMDTDDMVKNIKTQEASRVSGADYSTSQDLLPNTPPQETSKEMVDAFFTTLKKGGGKKPPFKGKETAP